MKTITLNLERTLKIRRHEDEGEVTLRITELYFDEHLKQWRCKWSLGGLCQNPVDIPGDDALHALMRTIDFATSFIRQSEDDGYLLTWMHDGDHGGMELPMTEELK